jgi:transcriptional regulator with PAS, ATPase and Fis domain
LLQSTLFGHERGAFTGAERVAPGLFERATGGTLFLDELGELSASAQAALLRVLETKRVSRLGAAEERAVDVRVIAATHRDLRQMVIRGQFREDLFYRLSPLPISVPPLRQRTADIVPLAAMFLQRASIEAQREVPRLSDALLTWLTEYHWPGNVRELGNAITYAVMHCTSETLSICDLSGSMSVLHQQGLRDVGPQEPEPPDGLSFRQRIRNLEIALITAALRATSGNQRRAAARLRIPLRTLVHKIHAYGLAEAITKKPSAGHSAAILEAPNACA